MSGLCHKVHTMKETNKITSHTPKNFNEATLLHTADTGSDEWAKWRMHGIGGSEVSTILGLNEYKSAFALWAERTGKVDIEPVDNWSVRFGRAFEMPILQMWADDNPEYEVFLTGTYVDNKEPHLQASPDALARHRSTGEWIVVEVKTARYSWDFLPVGYRAQLIHYLDVLGVNRGVVIAVAGWNWFESWVEYDEFEALAQRQAVTAFWKMIQDDKEPDYDGATSTYETMRKLHPDIDPDQEVELPNGEDLQRLQQTVDAWQQLLNREKTITLDIMDKAKTGFVMRDGKKVVVATRQARGEGLPFLTIRKEK